MPSTSIWHYQRIRPACWGRAVSKCVHIVAGCSKPRGKRKGQAKSSAAGSSEKKLARTPSKRIGVLTDEELAARSSCCDTRCRIKAISSEYTIRCHMDMSQ